MRSQNYRRKASFASCAVAIAYSVLFCVAKLVSGAQDGEQSLSEHFRAGKRAAAEQRFDDAIREFQAVLKLDPTLIQARANLGLMYYSKGEYVSSAEQFTLVVRAKPDLLPGELFLGLSDLNLAKPREAEIALRKALQLAPENKDARLALLTSCIEQDKYKAAGAELSKLKRQPPDEEILYAIGQAYLDMGKGLTARMAEAYPSSAWVHRLAGDLAADRQDWPQAVVSYEAALAAAPELPGLQATLANAAQKAGKQDEQQRAASVAVAARNRQDAPDQKLAPAIAAFAAKHLDVAAAEFESALETRQTPEVLYWLIRTYTVSGDEYFEKLEQSFPDSARAYQLRASIYWLQQDFPAALAQFQKAIKNRPDDARLHRSAGEMLVLLDRPAEAEAELEKASRFNPANAENEYLLAQVALKEKQTGAAINHLKKALALRPGLAEVHALLGIAYLHVNQPILAVPQLEKALSIDYYGDLHFQLYRAYRMSGNMAGAANALEESKRLRRQRLQSAVNKISAGSSAIASTFSAPNH